MFKTIRDKILTFLNKGNERTVLTKKNIAASFIIKGITIIISTIMVPLTINYANPERNGLWLTLYSMIMWLNLFDIGFGLGMRNRVAEAKAVGNNDLCRKYISSTYAIITLICIAIFALFCLINPHLDWTSILKNENPEYNTEITGFVWICVIAFFFTFILNLIKSVVAADQRPAIAAYLDMLGQLLTLAGIFILTKTTSPSLIYLGLVSGFAPIIVYLIANIYLFNTRYKIWRPSFRHIHFSLAGNMLNLGVKFFITSFAAFLTTQALIFIIQRVAGSVEVTNYNTAFRLFSVAFNVMGIIILPYWTSFTDAYSKGDFEWMKKSIRHLNKFFLYFIGVQIVLLIASPLIYYLWVNYWTQESNELDITMLMSTAVCLFTMVLCWTNIYIFPLNGIGKVKLQVYSAVFELLLIIPAAWFLGTLWGAPGIVLAPCLVYLPRIIWAPIQLNKLINNKASGIWNK